MLSRRRQCCKEEPTCGPVCTVCGREYALNYEGTYEDDNGSGVISEFWTTQDLNVGRAANPGGGDRPVWFDPSLATGTLGVRLATGKLSATGRVIPVGGFCPGESGEVSYAWGLLCSGETGISIILCVDVRADCSTDDPHVLAYRKAARMQPVDGFPSFPAYAVKEAEVTCEGRVLTATASGWEIPPSIFNEDVTIAPPSESVTITIPLNVPVHRFCCLPCPIPKADLTLTTDGYDTSTLAYDPGDNTWSDGVYTMYCEGGGVLIAGPYDEEWTIDAATYDCEPFHLEFTRDGDRLYVDL